jgi:MurNAc alpha-1-phosphate uridylyltransferase
MPYQCLVLAGGLGTRMLPRTESVPKALLPVAGVPFVDHQLRWLAGHGVDEAVLAIGHLGSMLRDHVGDGSRLGLSVRYVDEGDDLRGTAGAVRFAVDARSSSSPMATVTSRSSSATSAVPSSARARGR